MGAVSTSASGAAAAAAAATARGPARLANGQEARLAARRGKAEKAERKTNNIVGGGCSLEAD